MDECLASHFFQRYNAFIDGGWFGDDSIGLMGATMYLCYLRHAGKDGKSWPSNRLLVKEMGVYDDRRISSTRFKLISTGLLKLESPAQGQNAAIYSVLLPPVRKTPRPQDPPSKSTPRPKAPHTPRPKAPMTPRPKALLHNKEEQHIEQHIEQHMAEPAPPGELGSAFNKYMDFPLKGGKTWTLTKDGYTTLRNGHAKIDVKAELKLAKCWMESNPAKRKTAAGMMRCLNGWMARAKPKEEFAGPSAGGLWTPDLPRRVPDAEELADLQAYLKQCKAEDAVKAMAKAEKP